MKGIIVKGIGGFYYVRTADGAVYECRARGIFRRRGIKPTVGDRVEFDGGSIDEIEERKSFLVRPSVANIDILAIVVAAANPEPDLFLTDKLTVAAEAAGIEPSICINKTDLADGGDISAIYRSAGYFVTYMSAANGIGTGELADKIRGKICAFAGLSGVGKSSILNLITGEGAQTGEVSRINRGRHTTRHVELFCIDHDTYILDTPGFSSLSILDICSITAPGLAGCFPETRAAGECRFSGCAHINEPDCGVKELVSDGKMAMSRYENYKKLYEQLREVKEWEK